MSESVESLAGAKLPSISEIKVERPFEYQTEKYKREGKIGEEVGVTVIDLFLLKRAIFGKSTTTPESLQSLGALPALKAVSQTAKNAVVDIRKFSEYIFTPNSKGKDVVFRNLGYSEKDITHSKSRQFVDLPESVDWKVLRGHLEKMPDAFVTDYVSDGVTEMWLDFNYKGNRFSVNNQFGEY